MKVKMFDTTFSVTLYEMEKEINEFLATLKPNAVKHVQTAMAVARNENDQNETEYVVTVWYDEHA